MNLDNYFERRTFWLPNKLVQSRSEWLVIFSNWFLDLSCGQYVNKSNCLPRTLVLQNTAEENCPERMMAFSGESRAIEKLASEGKAGLTKIHVEAIIVNVVLQKFRPHKQPALSRSVDKTNAKAEIQGDENGGNELRYPLSHSPSTGRKIEILPGGRIGFA